MVSNTQHLPRFKPELYRIIRIDPNRPATLPPFLFDETVSADCRVVDTKRLATYGHWVQHVLLQSCHMTDLLDILKHCQNVEDLALCVVHGGSDQSLLEGLSLCRKLKKLTLLPSDFFYVPTIPFAHPAFSNITHLEIINFITNSWELWSQLTEMPRLTHLAITVDPALLTGIVLCLLIGCKYLKLLILVNQNINDDPAYELEKSWSNPSHYKLSELGPIAGWMLDSRVVLLNTSNLPLGDDPVGDWEMGARGGSDFWIIAEEIQAERLKFTHNQTVLDLFQFQ